MKIKEDGKFLGAQKRDRALQIWQDVKVPEEQGWKTGKPSTLHPLSPGNSSLASNIALNIWTLQIPHPLRLCNAFPQGWYQ